MNADRDKFAVRAWIACGTVGGALGGLLIAPRLLWRVRGLGVDPVALGPALVIIALAAAAGGFLTWRAVRR
jgi:hypothetical protein